jgi:Ca-activated chloride channel family protein
MMARPGRFWNRLAGPLVTSLAVCTASTPLRSQQPTPGLEQTTGSVRLWQTVPGSEVTAKLLAPEALSKLRARAEDEGGSNDWLALGAALLHSGDWEGATPPLRQALETSEPEMREDATYDLALAYAVSGHPEAPAGASEADTDDGGTPRDRLVRARDGFRAVLRENPHAEDARWNLELVQRWLDSDGSGGGSGDGGGGGGQAAGGPQSGGDNGNAPMTPEEAQRLLEAAAGQEREVQSRRLERNQDRDPRLEKNW